MNRNDKIAALSKEREDTLIEASMLEPIIFNTTGATSKKAFRQHLDLMARYDVLSEEINRVFFEKADEPKKSFWKALFSY